MNGENLLEQLSRTLLERDAARALLPDEEMLLRATTALEIYAEFGRECEEAEYTDTGTAWEVLDLLAGALTELTTRCLSGETFDRLPLSGEAGDE